MNIRPTKHATLKMAERDISIDDISAVLEKPESVEGDRFDPAIEHFMGSIKDKYLRVIGRREGGDVFVVISAFFDRRLARRMKHDKT